VEGFQRVKTAGVSVRHYNAAQPDGNKTINESNNCFAQTKKIPLQGAVE
jgi:hypothetical protein